MSFLRAIIFIAVLSGSEAALAAEPMQAGVGVVDITPPVPFRMSGYFNERLSTGTKDALYAKAVLFRQGRESAALVFCDFVGVPRDISSAARREAEKRTGIPSDHIAVAATHSHTGPLYFGALHDHFHERTVAREGSDPLDSAAYRAELIEKIAAAVATANAAARPVELRSGSALEHRVSFNRRFHMKDGSVRFNPGNLNPDIVRPAGPIDPQVGVITWSASNSEEPAAALVAFALHLDTLGGTEYSADYPRIVENRLRNRFGRDFTLLFGAGTCGDINHIDVTKEARRPTEEIGALLTESVERAIYEARLAATVEPSLAVRTTKIEAPAQKFSQAEVAQAREKLKLVGTRQLGFLDQVEAYKIVDLQRQPETIPLEVQAFRLNRETAIVTLPAEIFVELGLAIKAASPFETTLVVELANDSLGYIPTRKAFAEGSYETVNSRVEAGSGERLVEAAIKLLKELE